VFLSRGGNERARVSRLAPFLFSASTCAESAIRPRSLPFSLFHSAGGAGLRRRRKWKETRLYLPFIIPRQKRAALPISMPQHQALHQSKLHAGEETNLM